MLTSLYPVPKRFSIGKRKRLSVDKSVPQPPPRFRAFTWRDDRQPKEEKLWLGIAGPRQGSLSDFFTATRVQRQGIHLSR